MEEQLLEPAIEVGQTIDIYWPRDGRSYEATMTKITDTHVHVEYDDGATKAYPLPVVAAALAAAKKGEVRVPHSNVFTKRKLNHIYKYAHDCLFEQTYTLHTRLLMKHLRT